MKEHEYTFLAGEKSILATFRATKNNLSVAANGLVSPVVKPG